MGSTMYSPNLNSVSVTDTSSAVIIASYIRAFDFTLYFEELALSIAPSFVCLLLALLRIWSLRNRQSVLGGNKFRTVKITVLFALAGVQGALVASWALHSVSTQLSVACASISLVATLAASWLSFVEHAASPAPSVLLSAYLLLSTILDLPRIRTLSLLHYPSSIVGLMSASLGIRMLSFALEERSKRRFLHAEDRDYSDEECSGLVNRTLFLWLNRLLKSGFSTQLDIQQLPAIDRSLLSEPLWLMVGQKWDFASHSGNHALFVHVLKTLKWPMLAPAVPYLTLMALQFSQPLLINRLVRYLATQTDRTELDKSIGYGFIAGYGLLYICIAFATAWSQHLSYRFVTMLRATLVNLIYRKTVEMSIQGVSDASSVTLMSTDVERIVAGMARLHETWTAIIMIGAALFLLKEQVGIAFIVPLLMFLVTGLAVGFFSVMAGKFQSSWMKAIEKRVAVTSSMLGSMKGVKMSGLSPRLFIVVQGLRSAEIAAAAGFRSMLCLTVILSYMPNSLSPVITFAAYAVMARKGGKVIDSAAIFTSLALLSLITMPLAQISGTLPELFAAVACFERIQRFILASPRHDTRMWLRESKRVLDDEQPLGVELKPLLDHSEAITVTDGKFGWDTAESPVLQNINVTFAQSRLTIIMGPIASGKTTLLKAILGETPVAEGTVQMSSLDVSFCDQTPWLINDTLRRNITGFSHFHQEWYSAVIRACALEEDIASFNQGDQCMIGSKGVTLSGGQRQRVAIARAVYSKRKIAIFDDVFSGLDARTQEFVFKHVFGIAGLLKSTGTTVILATHATNIVPFADHIVALDNGTIIDQGSFEQLRREDRYLKNFDPTINSVEGPTDCQQEAKCGAQAPSDAAENAAQDLNNSGDATRRVGDRSVYKYYFQSIGIMHTIIFLVFQTVWLFMLKFPEVWLQWWGAANEAKPGAQDGLYLGVYGVLQVLGLAALGVLASHLLLVIVAVSGRKLHQVLLETTLRAPMSFFAITDVGSIINRFSQDIQLIDAELPIAFLNVFTNGLVCIAQAIMILPASWYLILMYPPLLGILYVLQKYYLRTSRQIRFLDLEAKSPIYSQFLETLNGLATVRAFGWENELVNLIQQRLDQSQKPFYLLFSIQRWLNLVLDLMVAGIAIVLVSVAVGLRGKTNAGFAGLALYNIMGLSSAMKAAIYVWTILETSIGAVARIKAFEQSTPSERKPEEKETPPESWPDRVEVRVSDLTVSYGEGNPPALSNVSFEIMPGEKVGICGRSGSGKSTLLLALFRMVEFSSGTITVDDVDISTLPRDTIRERLNGLPQDPTFLSGSVRLNCDPHEIHSNKEIIDALVRVHLWDAIASRGGLDTQLTQELFSHGQRQLFCLARALLHGGKILVMDEATSNLDPDTDNLIQETIRKFFDGATIISVAHRINTILDFDRVLVIERGVIIENDNPQVLLEKNSSFKALYQLYRAEGPGEDISIASA